MKRKFKKYNSVNALGDYIYRAFVLICRKCGKLDTHIIDQVMSCKADASRLFEMRGWKVEGEQVVCPECGKGNLTTEQRAAYDKAMEEQDRLLEPLVRANRESERLTADDFNIRINARDDD